ncbi:MAG: twin-arginine translocation signal domain-containing protein [Planctomycetota bacterium]
MTPERRSFLSALAGAGGGAGFLYE